MDCINCDSGTLNLVEYGWGHGDPAPAAKHQCDACRHFFLEFAGPLDGDPVLLNFSMYLRGSTGRSVQEWIADQLEHLRQPRSA